MEELIPVPTTDNNLLNITIKTINNETYTYDVAKTLSVLALKTLIAASTNIVEERQRLIYRGRVLVDENALQDYNIEAGQIVHMVAKPENFRELQQAAGVNSTPATPSAPSTTTRPTPPQQSPLFNITGIPQNPMATTPTQPNNEEPTENQEEQGLEYLRQGLLTVNTLLTTITPEVTASSSSSSPIPNPQILSTPHAVLSNRNFYLGQWLDVKDTVNQWLEATVLDIDYRDRKVFVHYNGWPQRWDEWINFNSPRIAPFRSRTTHSSLGPHFNPTPNNHVRFAPATGVNDLRLLLPEVARLNEQLTPLLNQLGQASVQNVNYDSDLRERIDQIPQRGLPWEHNQENNNDTSPDNRDASNEQLRLLAQELCPVIDRFGRVLLDLVPQLWTLANGNTHPQLAAPAPTNQPVGGFNSIESRLLSLLRERPPSPPPLRSHRSPILSAPINPAVAGLPAGLRALRMGNGTAFGLNPTNLTGGRTPGSNNGQEHHVDIHIAILSPQGTLVNPNNLTGARNNNGGGLANISSSLQEQSAQLAARARELSARTTLVTEITNALTQNLQNLRNEATNLSNQTPTNTNNNESQTHEHLNYHISRDSDDYSAPSLHIPENEEDDDEEDEEDEDNQENEDDFEIQPCEDREEDDDHGDFINDSDFLPRPPMYSSSEDNLDYEEEGSDPLFGIRSHHYHQYLINENGDLSNSDINESTELRDLDSLPTLISGQTDSLLYPLPLHSMDLNASSSSATAPISSRHLNNNHGLFTHVDKAPVHHDTQPLNHSHHQHHHQKTPSHTNNNHHVNFSLNAHQHNSLHSTSNSSQQSTSSHTNNSNHNNKNIFDESQLPYWNLPNERLDQEDFARQEEETRPHLTFVSPFSFTRTNEESDCDSSPSSLHETSTAHSMFSIQQPIDSYKYANSDINTSEIPSTTSSFIQTNHNQIDTLMNTSDDDQQLIPPSIDKNIILSTEEEELIISESLLSEQTLTNNTNNTTNNNNNSSENNDNNIDDSSINNINNETLSSSSPNNSNSRRSSGSSSFFDRIRRSFLSRS